ncbi:methylenetetrahydrofolate reduct [Linnemannia elongata AG-77]|uniref:Methylenetetrahydrofolate reduct n=1 Tax=Linnemannia elongata AG-77 TaxID=1314771 RepID=A0A197K2S3_9FUNG|nr:methylenetetrahydrofolate reduct [Linnemannia elongata AG-77]
MKIVDRIHQRQEEGRPFFSFEYFSPKTAQGMINLNDRIERMCHLSPEFVDITWGAGGSRPAATLEVVSNVQKVLGVETCMHLICTDNPIKNIDKALKEARACGNQNILALRGDAPSGQKSWTPCKDGLPSATALVRHIRATHGDYFGIGVAAYPELHPESPTLEHDLYYLKQKIDAGADFIVTQLFFDVPKFLDWVREVRRYGVGIEVPIVPGLMPIQTYAGFKKNVVDAGLSVPQWILDGLEAVKEDEVAVRQFGVEVGVKMVRELVESGLVAGVHFYTFNLEKSTRLILEGAGLVPFIRKDKPWRTHFLPHRRRQEHQRPIFWANRPKSYISRTETWHQFPSTANQWQRSVNKYGSLEGYGVGIKYPTAAEARLHWSNNDGRQPRRVGDLSEVFQRYWRGELQTLPWCDHPCGAGVESGGEWESYRDRLVELNGVGCYLAINAQPVVNGVKSDDKVLGWGPSGGYVYQKAFLEFFVSPDQLPILIDRLKTQYPTYTYNAINHSDDEEEEEEEEEEPNTVTWGVFPNHEIVQPTIVERSSFLAWKDEAFALWDQWAQCFEGGETESDLTRKVLDEVRGTWYLMNIVNNDYHEPTGVFDLFEEDFVRVKEVREADAKVVAVEASDVSQVLEAKEVTEVEEEVEKATRRQEEKDGSNVFSNALAAVVVAAAAAAGGRGVCQELVVVENIAVAEANCSA